MKNNDETPRKDDRYHRQTRARALPTALLTQRLECPVWWDREQLVREGRLRLQPHNPPLMGMGESGLIATLPVLHTTTLGNLLCQIERRLVVAAIRRWLLACSH